MDEKSAVSEPLLSEYANEKQDLPAPVSADVPQRQSRGRNWKRLGKVIVLGLATLWMVKSLYRKSLLDEFDWSPYESLLNNDLSPAETDFTSDGLAGGDWITLDKDYFTHHHANYSFNFSTTAEKIAIFSRGPILGNITLLSGETKGDDVEIDIAFVESHWKKHPKHKKPEDEDDEEHGHHDEDDEDEGEGEDKSRHLLARAWTGLWSRADDNEEDHHPHPHPHHRPPPKVKVHVVYKDGELTAIGLLAYRPKPHHRHHPKHPRHESEVDESEQAAHPKPHWPHWPHKKPGPPHRRRHHGPPAIASITIRFPLIKDTDVERKDGKYLVIPAFETHLPFFKHFVHDLKTVQFHKFSLATVGRPVFVGGVSATFLKVVAIKGPIFGNFASSKFLSLVSFGKPIAANVALFSGPHEKWFNATRFDAVTQNSWIKANISLHTDGESEAKFAPSYHVKTFSSGSSTWRGHTHSGTNLTFVEQPNNASLIVDSAARLAPVTVSLPPAFQGHFDLVAPFSRPELAVNEGAEDPLGEGRHRVVTLKKSWTKFKLSGAVGWFATEEARAERATGGCHGRRDDVAVETEAAAEKKPAFSHVKLVTTKRPTTLVLA